MIGTAEKPIFRRLVAHPVVEGPWRENDLVRATTALVGPRFSPVKLMAEMSDYRPIVAGSREFQPDPTFPQLAGQTILGTRDHLSYPGEALGLTLFDVVLTPDVGPSWREKFPVGQMADFPRLANATVSVPRLLNEIEENGRYLSSGWDDLQSRFPKLANFVEVTSCLVCVYYDLEKTPLPQVKSELERGFSFVYRTIAVYGHRPITGRSPILEVDDSGLLLFQDQIVSYLEAVAQTGGGTRHGLVARMDPVMWAVIEQAARSQQEEVFYCLSYLALLGQEVQNLFTTGGG